MLAELLRKKMEPASEEWVDEGRRAGTALAAPTNPPVQSLKDGNEKSNGALQEGDDAATQLALTDAEIEELWEWAAPAGNQVARSVLFAEDAEDSEAGSPMEGVSTPGAGTGARARPQQAVQSMMPLEELLRFVSVGVGTQGQGGMGR